MRLTILLLLLFATMNLFAQFTEGNLVVFRIGDGVSAIRTDNTGNPAFLDEYTPAGTLVQSIPIPTTDAGANKAFVSRYSLVEGLIKRSTDGRYLAFPGYNGTVGSAAALRLIGRIDFSENINLTTTFPTSGTFSSAISDNGVNFWAASSDQVHYTTLGASSATAITGGYGTGVRDIGINDGQLYVSTANSISAIGSGKPATGGQSFNNLPGGFNGNFYQYVMLDMTPGVAGPDVIYVADQNGTIDKYSLVGGTWVMNGTIPSTSYTIGLTGETDGTSATLYVTNANTFNASGGGRIQKLVDAGGYNASISGALTTLATAATNTTFRGIAFSPTQFILPVKFVGIQAVKKQHYIELKWTTAGEDKHVQYSIERSLNGTHFQSIGRQSGSGTEHSFIDASQPVEIVFYRISATEPNQKITYSPVIKVHNKTTEFEMGAPVVHNGRLNVNLSGTIAGNYQFVLVNPSGQVIHKENRTIGEGVNLISISLANVTKGIYFLSVDGPAKAVKKILVP